MDWSSQQLKAIDAFRHWYQRKPDQQVFRIFGYAGTGKTTLAKHLAAEAGKVLYVACTGKAAHVMRMKGCANAQTIHSLIYTPTGDAADHIKDIKNNLEEAEMAAYSEMRAENPDMPKEQLQFKVQSLPGIKTLRRSFDDAMQRIENGGGGPRFTLRPDSDIKQSDLVVVDECSMIDDRMAEDLLSFGVRLLVLGDPFQLPPVKGVPHFTGTKPDVLLTEIHRQSEDSPIIDLATMIRNGKRLVPGTYGDSRVVAVGAPKDELAAIVLAADQVIVGTNDNRKNGNVRMRKLLGLDRKATPVKGDRVICLRNDRETGMLNGSMWDVTAASDEVNFRLELDITPRDVGAASKVIAHAQYFHGKEPAPWDIRTAQCFDYAYCITAHKSQGSQFDSVVVFDESHRFRQDGPRWLYTAVTRAAKRVVVVQTI